MIAALDFAEFMQKIAAAVAKIPNAKIFSRPTLSANIPGIMRPNVDAPLRIAAKYPASVVFIPLLTAYVGR